MIVGEIPGVTPITDQAGLVHSATIWEVTGIMDGEEWVWVWV